jgi:hypothetical protein
MKTSSEPCIRGHRSTKCTHANERLMVPVRKPGRPLSACPHPRDQGCGCGSVTAAIPRKQTCHCGTGTPPQSAGSQIVPQPTNPLSDAPSPTKVAFKVQKSSRPPSSRKMSFDPANFERMDMNQVHIMPFEQRVQNIPTNGYVVPQSMYGYAPQYANIQPQFGQVPMQPPPPLHGIDGPVPHTNGTNGFSNGLQNGLENVIESPLATPTTFESGDSGKYTNGASYKPVNNINGNSRPSEGGSCCAPKQKSHSHSSPNGNSKSVPAAAEPPKRSCCSSKPDQQTLKEESMSTTSSAHSTPQIPHQILPQNGVSFNPTFYQQYLPQTTVFTYPPTYGSFQNPLQPSEWRQSFRSNNYTQQPIPLPSGAIPFDTALVPDTLDTVHSCCCGDTCQCIGCAAHPYNDATQDYVRSAWASMSIDRSTSDPYSNGNTPINGNGNGVMPIQPKPVDVVSSPTAHTPSSSTSGNGEEQSLSASDFFFVNYSFVSDGCGGDTESCPCGDDCQCLGCTIHNQPAIPCGGEEGDCPCGDDCECIGCEIHKGGTMISTAA